MRRILMLRYVERGFVPPPEIHLTEKCYEEMRSGVVLGCVDIVLIDREGKRIYLAKRKIRPMMDLWWMGGKADPRMRPEISAAEKLFKETGLRVLPERLRLVALIDNSWKDRECKPQNMGCHDLVLTFALDVTPGEAKVASDGLCDREYDKSFGLVPFAINELLERGVHPAIIDLYDEIFSERVEILKRLAMEDDISYEELVTKLLREEDARRHKEVLPYEDKPRVKRCHRDNCSVESQMPPEPYSLGN